MSIADEFQIPKKVIEDYELKTLKWDFGAITGLPGHTGFKPLKGLTGGVKFEEALEIFKKACLDDKKDKENGWTGYIQADNINLKIERGVFKDVEDEDN